MMATTSIEWTEATWNPVVGCTRASAGCDHCYAVTMTKRLAAMGQAKYAGLVNEGKGHFNGVVRCVEEALPIPMSWKKPRLVFVNSMSDLFHPDVPFPFIERVHEVIRQCPQHTFQILTKRPERIVEYWEWRQRHWLNASVISNPPWNAWYGTSVEDQAAADARIPHLLRCPAAVRFLSCEPLLGAVDLTRIGTDREVRAHGDKISALVGIEPHGGPEPVQDSIGLDWVIVGGESGPGARPMDEDWVRSLRDQCVSAGVPFFYKQNVVNGKKVGLPDLDGKQWAQFPATPAPTEREVRT